MKRNVYKSYSTKRMLSSVFPSNFDIVNNPNSNGFKLCNIISGLEFDMFYDEVYNVRDSMSLYSYDFGNDYNLAQVVIPKTINTSVIGKSFGKNATVKFVDSDTFYNGKPTRIQKISSTTIPNVIGAYGLEYTKADAIGNGIVRVSINTEYDNVHIYKVDSLGTIDFVNYTKNTVGVGFNNFNITGKYEILYPLGEQYLMDNYPEYRTIKELNKVTGNMQDYQIAVYNPDNGYIWDDYQKTYVAIGSDSDFIFNNDGTKQYSRVSKNNPYGIPGVYDIEKFKLQRKPILSSVKLYDIDIFSETGKVSIPSSGKNVYSYDIPNGVNYVGYDSIVPIQFNNTGTRLDASIKCKTSWTIVDDEIIITNPISRYMIEYDYYTNESCQYISSYSSNNTVSIEDNSFVMSGVPKDMNIVTVDGELSNEPISEKNRVGVKFRNSEVRNGEVLDTVYINGVLTSSYNINSINKTITLSSTLPGAIQYLSNRNVLPRYKVCSMYNFTRSNSNGITSTTPTSYNYDPILIISSGNSYLSKSYIEFESPNHITNRTICLKFKLLGDIVDTTLIQSYNGTDDKWKIELDKTGRLIISDINMSFKSVKPISLKNTIELKIIRNNIGANNLSDDEYMLINSYDTKPELIDLYPVTFNDYDITTGTKAFINTSVIIYELSIYDEVKR